MEGLAVLRVVGNKLVSDVVPFRDLPVQAPQDAQLTGSTCFRPPESKVVSDLFNSVRIGRKIYLAEHERQQIQRRLNRLGCFTTACWITVAVLHTPEELGFVAPVVNQHRLLNSFEYAKEFFPNLPLVFEAVRPQAVLDGGLA